MEELKSGKTLLLMFLSVGVIALVLSGCFLIPKPVVHFTAPTTANVSAYPINSTIAFEWFSSQSNLKYTLTLAASGSTPVTLLNGVSDTSFTTDIATPGVYTAEITAKNNTGGEGKDTVEFNVTSLQILSATPVYASQAVTVSWKSLDDQTHEYEYSLGGTWVATTGTSVDLTNLANGNYTFQVRIKNSYIPAAVYRFQILTYGPTLRVAASDRTVGGIYGIVGSHPQGREALVSWESDQKLGGLYVRFYQYDGSGTGNRYRLNINPDGTWEVLDPNSTAQQWYMIDPNETEMVVSAVGYGSIPVYDMSGNEYDIPAFEFGKTYGIGLLPINWLGTQGTFGITLLTLSERYSESDMPELYVGFDKTSIATGSTFTAYVMAPNVTAYSSGTHEVVNDGVDHTDITVNDGLMYTQFSVALTPGLQVTSVSFPDMEAGKANISTYTYDPTNNVLTIYRGFVASKTGVIPASSATDIAAKIEVTVPATYDFPVVQGKLVYAGYYGPYGYANYNPVFKDNSNRNIDGIVTVPDVVSVTVWTGQSSM